MNRWSTLGIALAIGCTPPSDTSDADVDDVGFEEPFDPIGFDAFQDKLIIEACAGFFRGDHVHPTHRGILRIRDEESCRALLSPDDLEPHWAAYVAALDAGDLTFDGVAAARCLDDVEFAIGNGYMSWLNAGHCSDVLTGFGAVGDACGEDDECAPGLECRESACFTARPCVDTHECPDGEWCEEGCRSFQPKAAAGEHCVVFTDDGFPEDCDVGLTCPMLAYVGDEDDALYFYASCIAPQEVGDPCHRDLDCEFGLQCDRGACPDNEPCPDAICAVP